MTFIYQMLYTRYLYSALLISHTYVSRHACWEDAFLESLMDELPFAKVLQIGQPLLPEHKTRYKAGVPLCRLDYERGEKNVVVDHTLCVDKAAPYNVVIFNTTTPALELGEYKKIIRCLDRRDHVIICRSDSSVLRYFQDNLHADVFHLPSFTQLVVCSVSDIPNTEGCISSIRRFLTTYDESECARLLLNGFCGKHLATKSDIVSLIASKYAKVLSLHEVLKVGDIVAGRLVYVPQDDAYDIGDVDGVISDVVSRIIRE
jgi:hypothetical protein